MTRAATEGFLHEVYTRGGRLKLVDGKIKPGRVEGAWTDDEKTAIRSRRKELRTLLENDYECIAEHFARSLKEALAGAPPGCDFADLIGGDLEAGQDAYERGDIGLTRYHLREFVEGCEKRRIEFENAPEQGELVHVEAEVPHRDAG